MRKNIFLLSIFIFLVACGPNKKSPIHVERDDREDEPSDDDHDSSNDTDEYEDDEHECSVDGHSVDCEECMQDGGCRGIPGSSTKSTLKPTLKSGIIFSIPRHLR